MSAAGVMVPVVAAHARPLPSRLAPTPLAVTRTRVRATRVHGLHSALAADVLAECVGPRRKDTVMTQNRDRKQKIRARMAATGEPYTEAARHVERRAAACGGLRRGTPGLVRA